METCPDCGDEVSDRAETCPHCGYPLALARAEAAESDEHGLYRCVNGAKVPEPFQFDGGPCPFCHRTLRVEPSEQRLPTGRWTGADPTTKPPTPIWQNLLIIVALIAVLLLLYVYVPEIRGIMGGE
jgi:hypothetical protein